jgi:Polysaccharide lyase
MTAFNLGRKDEMGRDAGTCEMKRRRSIVGIAGLAAVVTVGVAMAASSIEPADKEAILVQLDAVQAELDQAQLDQAQAELDVARDLVRALPVVEPPPPPSPPPPPVNGKLVQHDPMTNPDPLPLWRRINAESPTRAGWFASGGPDDKPFRRCNLFDGDDFYGERCTFGRNNRFDTFYTAQEGDHLRHEFWFRLPANYNMGYWSIIAGWKHGEPCPNPKNEGLRGENTSSAPIQIQVRPNHLELRQHGSVVLYKTQDVSRGEWHHVALEIRFTGQSTNGSLQLTLDGVASPTFRVRTMKRAASSGNGLQAGDTIPSLLMTGVYRNPAMSRTTYVDLADVRIYDLG